MRRMNTDGITINEDRFAKDPEFIADVERAIKKSAARKDRNRPADSTEKAILAVFSLALLPLDGFATSRMWNWFIATRLHVPSVSTAEGFGLSLLAALMTHQWSKQDDSYDAQLKMFSYALVTPLIVLGFGWMTKAWWL